MKAFPLILTAAIPLFSSCSKEQIEAAASEAEERAPGSGAVIESASAKLGEFVELQSIAGLSEKVEGVWTEVQDLEFSQKDKAASLLSGLVDEGNSLIEKAKSALGGLPEGLQTQASTLLTSLGGQLGGIETLAAQIPGLPEGGWSTFLESLKGQFGSLQGGLDAFRKVIGG